MVLNKNMLEDIINTIVIIIFSFLSLLNFTGNGRDLKELENYYYNNKSEINSIVEFIEDDTGIKNIVFNDNKLYRLNDWYESDDPNYDWDKCQEYESYKCTKFIKKNVIEDVLLDEEILMENLNKIETFIKNGNFDGFSYDNKCGLINFFDSGLYELHHNLNLMDNCIDYHDNLDINFFKNIEDSWFVIEYDWN